MTQRDLGVRAEHEAPSINAACVETFAMIPEPATR